MSIQVPKQCESTNSALIQSVDRRWLARIFAKLKGRTILALVDQGVVSAVTFVASVVVGRSCGAESLGVYSLALTIVILVLAVHTSVVSTPYTVFRGKLADDDQQTFAGSSLVSSLIVMLTSVYLLFMILPVFVYTSFEPAFPNVLIALILILPFLIMREFARRFAFANFEMRVAIAIDVAVAVIQISLLLYLAYTNQLTPALALAAMGFSCAVTAIVWGIASRKRFSLNRLNIGQDISKKWVLGRWVLSSHIIGVVSGLLVPWMLLFMVNVEATGIFAACMVVVSISSPFMQGMGNVLSPKFAEAAATHSQHKVKRLFWKSNLFMMGTLMAFVLLCVFAGEFAVQFLYGQEYANYGLVVILLAVRMVIAAANISAYHALLAMEKPLYDLFSAIVGMIAAVTAGVLLIPEYGINGGAIAALTGTAVEFVTIYWGYFTVVNKFPSDPGLIPDVELK